MAQTIAEQKQTKTLRFQDEKMEEEMIFTLRGGHGWLQEGY